MRIKHHEPFPRLAWVIGTALISRFALNTARRFAYPFAPALSRGLGVPLSAITPIIAANQATGILSIFIAPIGDAIGYRRMMLAALVMLAVGMFAGGAVPFYGVVLTALFLAGLGKSIFDPALQAYIGKQVPFHRRGLVIGIIEMSWAGSSLLGLPAAGLLINRLSWRAPFFALGVMALLAIMLLRVSIPRGKNPAAAAHRSPVRVLYSWRLVLRSRAALGVLGYAFFVSAANDNLFVVLGAWLEHSFDLSIVAVGLSAGVIGLAELLGELLTASLADRLGLKRAIFLGLLLSGFSYLLLPVLGRSLPALTGLFIVFVTTEFAIVASMSFVTEVLPEARATMMSGFLASSSIGRICGTLLGGSLWVNTRIDVIGAVSAGLTGLALVSLIWGLYRRRPVA